MFAKCLNVKIHMKIKPMQNTEVNDTLLNETIAGDQMMMGRQWTDLITLPPGPCGLVWIMVAKVMVPYMWLPVVMEERMGTTVTMMDMPIPSTR